MSSQTKFKFENETKIYLMSTTTITTTTTHFFSQWAVLTIFVQENIDFQIKT